MLLIAARASTTTQQYRPSSRGGSMVVAVVPAVARMVSLSGPRAALGLPHYLGFVGALLNPVHRVREGWGHRLEIRRRINAFCLLPAGGAYHRVFHLCQW